MTLTQLFTAIANAIRAKKGTSETITASNFPSEIASITTGVDTTDANAVANDIVTGKTAYVNNVKLTGTYTGIVPTGTKSITQNGTVDVSNYASANVNVSGSGGKNNQCNMGFYITTRTSYVKSSLKLTVAKTGTYTVKWVAKRDGSSNTWGTGLYINNVLYGSKNEEWGASYFLNNVEQATTVSTFQSNTIEHVNLAEGQEVEIFGKSGSNGSWLYLHALSIEEE